MNRFVSLMQREWMQHRKGWMWMAAIPLAATLALFSLGQVRIESDAVERAGAFFPTLLALVAIAGTTAVIFAVVWVSSIVIVSGLPRRDHGDRSVEFWLSLPVGHGQSLAAPLFVHLLVAPAVALLVGLIGGYAVSMALVGRLVGFGEWLGLPWGQIAAATLVFALRLLAGLPLATLWLAPLILAVMLTTAFFGRWGWVILTAGLGVGSALLKAVFGQWPFGSVTGQLLRHAARALVHGHGEDSGPFVVRGADEAMEMLRRLPGWAALDFAAALRDLATPLMPAALLFAAVCFALLVAWRRRSAGAG